MQRIIDTLEMQPILPTPYAEKLVSLGMRQNEYPMITDDAIFDFLVRMLKKESKKEDRHGRIVREFDVAQDHGGIRHKVKTGCVHRETIKRRFLWDKQIKSNDWSWTFYWDEKPITKYTGNPPDHVLEAALRAKKLGYVNLRVVTTNAKVVEDPLLIAFKDDNRYLIDWWDKDFTADEIIALAGKAEIELPSGISPAITQHWQPKHE